MKIHFIAIGGSVMHNLAITLVDSGHTVTGSDDDFFEPSRSRLAIKNLLPFNTGWDETRIHKNLDAVVLGMHATEDNPELKKAREFGLKIYSYPEFIYEHSKNKHRAVISGSHGKTTITAMVMHVLHFCKMKFDYLVGSTFDNFQNAVKISDDAQLLVCEGDEYPASVIDKKPKMLLYKPHVALISGIAWDHINVFPTKENYTHQFEELVKTMEKGTHLILNGDDPNVKMLEGFLPKDVNLTYYNTPKYHIKNKIYHVSIDDTYVPVKVFGRHNMQNIEGARQVCKKLSIRSHEFAEAIQSFTGADKRLEKIFERNGTIVFKDFAHSPSKVKASVDAVAERYRFEKIIGCLELHTFSSLNKNYLGEYKNALNKANEKIVFISRKALEHKNLPLISEKEIQEMFGDKSIHVIYEQNELVDKLKSVKPKMLTALPKELSVKVLRNLRKVKPLRKKSKRVFLLMSSGTFDNLNFAELNL